MWIEGLMLFSVMGFAITLFIYFFRLFFLSRGARQAQSFFSSELMQRHPDLAVQMIRTQLESPSEQGECRFVSQTHRPKSIDDSHKEGASHEQKDQ